MRGLARAPGTCGELIQGTIGDVNFHVTCPVDLYSEVEVSLKPGQNFIILNTPMRKVEEAVARTLAFFGMSNFAADVKVKSPLPVGKGMASSTADITAACVATAEAAGKSIAPGDIARIALSIEPTDGLMYPGLVLFDHVAGRMFRSLKMPPEIKIMVVDAGGAIDTERFNARTNLTEMNRQKENIIRQALDILEEGFNAGDWGKIGRAATMSAIANQPMIYKPELTEIIDIAHVCRAFGINTAHSGTVIGILYHEETTNKENMKDKILAVKKDFQLTECTLISGGAEIPVAEGGEELWKPYNTYMEGTSELRQQSMG